MPLSVGNLLLGTASQPMMSAIASSYASGKQDTLTFGYDTSNKITSIDGSAIVGEGAGDTSQCFPASASGMLQPSGDYAYNSSLSSYLPASASGDFITSTAGLAPSGDYAYNSSLSSFITYSALESASGVITGISGTAIGSTGGSVPPTAELLIDTASMSGSSDESSNYHIGVRNDVFVPSSSISSYATTASLSQKLDTSAFTGYTASVIPVVIIGNSADATAANTVYVVTGEPS